MTSGTDSLLSASYNGDGERVSKTDFWTGARNYSWGPGGILADSSGSTTYTPGFSQRQNGTDRFFHTDWLGSTRYLSDSSGSLPDTLGFDAFGNRTSASTSPYPTEFQFGATSGYQTEYASSTDPGVGLQLLGERYYDPVVGRFISPDPLGFDGGLNLYAYCGNDPVNCTDPDGEFVGALVALSVAIRVADVVALVYDSTELVRDLSTCGTPGWKTTLDGLAVGFDLLSFDAGAPSVTGLEVRTAEAAIVRASAGALAREAAERTAFRAGVYAAKASGGSGPYDHLKEPRNVGPGRKTTPA